MKKYFGMLCLAFVLAAFAACGGTKSRDNMKFAGSFTDEFGNKFVLNDDYSGTVQFYGMEPDTISWSDGVDHKRPYATIRWNGDPHYYFLRDGKLYRHEEDMGRGRPAIDITYDD